MYDYSIIPREEDYIRQYGIPESTHTDQGRQFESDIIKHLCSSLGIEKTRTSPYYAQSDGMVEKLNRILKDQLAKYMYQSSDEWDQYLQAHRMHKLAPRWKGPFVVLRSMIRVV